MKELWFYVCAVIIIILIAVIFMFFADNDGTEDKNIAFLEKYGWEVKPGFIECEDIVIPEEFDDVYTDYNDIQKAAGLDIEKYKGKRGVRYTYIVENYPDETSESVRANVICIDGIPVAGDIMTVGLHGFMYPLNHYAQ
ncbi:MAG: DUF4830 domain-containing protein [Oscillospiraceae bacterium]|nr:DUF4830 domain-containing protein [Oscillospiraceae bacterium]